MSVNSIAAFRRACLSTVALAAFMGTAFAQATPGEQSGQAAPSSGAEEVVVTGTRIVREGFVAPTPVTTVTADDLKIAGYTNLGDALAVVPGNLGDVTPDVDATHSNLGMSMADLRGLGPNRTLTLIDGERPVSQSATGFDMNTIPISLVQRVDIVTGGASAAWGSDAVAGVVNIVLNNDFVGERVNFQYGQDGQGYGQNEMASVAFGTHFGPDDRGHFMIAGQWNSNAMITAGRVPEANDSYIANTACTPACPAGQKPFVLVPNYNYAILSTGGLITAVNNTKNGGSALVGTSFAPGGVPYTFQYGAYHGGPFMSGGDPEAIGASYYSGESLLPSDDRKSLYSRVSYDVFSNLTVKADFLYSNNSAEGALIPPSTLAAAGPATIQSTNPYIPASIAAEMAKYNVSSFSLGRANTDFDGVNGAIPIFQHTQTYWGDFGIHGYFGDNWSYDLFYDYGVTNTQATNGPMPIRPLFAESVNAIAGPGGTPVCASTALKNPVTGATCAPINLFGYGAPSQAALNFFEGVSQNWLTIAQNEAGGEVQGEPVSNWAGPVSVAGGFEWRTESLKQTVNALAASPVDFGPIGQQTPLGGHYSVAEGFFETVVPLLKDLPAAKEFDFNGAVRETDYNTFGAVTEWKLGATDRVTDEFLARITFSQDIRAPNITELYSAQSGSLLLIHDPAMGNATVQVPSLSGGNPNLLPETAHTMTYGGVYSPDWLPGFNLSVDWWSVILTNAIATLPAQDLITFCYEGDAQACADVVRNSSGTLTEVYTYESNLAKFTLSGLDVEASDHIELSDVWDALPGSLDSHWLLTYSDKGNESLGPLEESAMYTSFLRWRTTLTETYTLGQFQSYVRFRFSSGMQPPQAQDIVANYNHIDAQYYVDFGASYFLTDDKKYQVYANLVNAFDRSPPLIPQPVFYDMFGRTFNVGVRIAF